MTGPDGQHTGGSPGSDRVNVPERPGLQRPTAEPPVWTARMLATLEKGVTGGRWYSLIDKLYPDATLRSGLRGGGCQPRRGRGGSCQHRALCGDPGRQPDPSE